MRRRISTIASAHAFPVEHQPPSPHFPRNSPYPGPTRIEWCHANGNAHHTNAPKIACPSANTKIFRSFANNHAIPTPPTNVNGTNTGFGQCNNANTAPATNAAGSAFSNADSNRFITNEFSPTCCNKQNARYPPNRRISTKCSGRLCSIPRNNPAAKISRELTPKNKPARFAALHKLSPRHPIVFGVSRRATKLATSHTTITHHVHGAANCNFQIYAPRNPANPSASTKHDHRYQLHFTPIVPSPSDPLPGIRPSIPINAQTTYRCRLSPRSVLNIPSTQNPEIPDSSLAPAIIPAIVAPVPPPRSQSIRTPPHLLRPQTRTSSASPPIVPVSPAQ